MNEKELLEQLSILYVEDDDIVRLQTGKFLKRRCKIVYEAANGQIGLELYKEYRPKVVITDIELPLMNGIELIKAIFEINRNQPIIITTAFEDETHSSKKACTHMIKPINNKILLEIIIECIRNKTQPAK